MAQPKKILLVEDETFIADLYKFHLENAGFITRIAKDGLEALDALKTGRYDLILLDIMLPKLNGLEVLKKCRQEETLKNTPIVLLTNLANRETIMEGFKLGADGYLIKASYTPLQLIPEIQNFLQGKPGSMINTTPPQP